MTLQTVIILAVLGVLASAVLIWSFIKTGRPIASLLKTCIFGLITMGCINLIGNWTGVTLNVNAVSLSCASVLGAPGVAVMLICNAIFI